MIIVGLILALVVAAVAAFLMGRHCYRLYPKGDEEMYRCELCGHVVTGPVKGRSCGQDRMVVSRGTYRTGQLVSVPCGGKFVWAEGPACPKCGEPLHTESFDWDGKSYEDQWCAECDFSQEVPIEEGGDNG